MPILLRPIENGFILEVNGKETYREKLEDFLYLVALKLVEMTNGCQVTRDVVINPEEIEEIGVRWKKRVETYVSALEKGEEDNPPQEAGGSLSDQQKESTPEICFLCGFKLRRNSNAFIFDGDSERGKSNPRRVHLKCKKKFEEGKRAE